MHKQIYLQHSVPLSGSLQKGEMPASRSSWNGMKGFHFPLPPPTSPLSLSSLPSLILSPRLPTICRETHLKRHIFSHKMEKLLSTNRYKAFSTVILSIVFLFFSPFYSPFPLKTGIKRKCILFMHILGCSQCQSEVWNWHIFLTRPWWYQHDNISHIVIPREIGLDNEISQCSETQSQLSSIEMARQHGWL